jgi:hypothetical protein
MFVVEDTIFRRMTGENQWLFKAPSYNLNKNTKELEYYFLNYSVDMVPII